MPEAASQASRLTRKRKRRAASPHVLRNYLVAFVSQHRLWAALYCHRLLLMCVARSTRFGVDHLRENE